MSDKPWVKIYDDNWDDAIVGNKAGLLALKQAIDDAIANGDCVETKGRFEGDFGLVAHSQHAVESTIQPAGRGLFGLAIMALLFFWGLVLPCYGVWAFFKGL
ncbi:hypothetical protein [Gallaecimonas mangrovi]|uniref:hypothetical protein n=1 Tax=Gallaecimonas mangrovi TaxID=2291597 RepID=UPI000E207574|nr:hypothetical protein [Gallaecimonas mangrovi]